MRAQNLPLKISAHVALAKAGCQHWGHEQGGVLGATPLGAQQVLVAGGTSEMLVNNQLPPPSTGYLMERKIPGKHQAALLAAANFPHLIRFLHSSPSLTSAPPWSTFSPRRTAEHSQGQRDRCHFVPPLCSLARAPVTVLQTPASP